MADNFQAHFNQYKLMLHFLLKTGISQFCLYQTAAYCETECSAPNCVTSFPCFLSLTVICFTPPPCNNIITGKNVVDNLKFTIKLFFFYKNPLAVMTKGFVSRICSVSIGFQNIYEGKTSDKAVSIFPAPTSLSVHEARSRFLRLLHSFRNSASWLPPVPVCSTTYPVCCQAR